MSSLQKTMWLALLGVVGCTGDGPQISNQKTPPACVINFPSDETIFDEDEVIEFVGTISDAKGMDDIQSVVWTSSIDGELGTPELVAPDSQGRSVFATLLSAGSHAITLAVTDYDALSDEDSVKVTVTAAEQAPTVSISTPEDFAVFDLDDGVLFSGIVADLQDEPEELYTTWTLVDVDSGTVITLGEGPAEDTGATSTEWVADTPGNFRVTLEVEDTDDNVNSMTRFLVVEDPGDRDEDGDGFSPNNGDCNDADPDTNPAADELCGNERDNDCNGVIDDRDRDADAHIDEDCTEYTGPLPVDDCDDDAFNVYPGAAEVEDGVDNDCDGDIDDGTPAFDDDGDCYCETAPCLGSINGACGPVNPGDCDDATDTTHPGAPEILDGEDNDCDGFIDEGTTAFDDDGDCYCEVGPCEGSVVSCPSVQTGDCNDTDPTLSPLAPEVLDGIDNNCNGFVDEGTDAFDDDGDCFCETAPCEGSIDGTCFVVNPGDCDDAAIAVFPGATEVQDGIDNDCDTWRDEESPVFDDDGDCYCESGPCTGSMEQSCGTVSSGDCDDTDDTVSPVGIETADARDNNCDGRIDEGTVAYDDDGDCSCEIAPCQGSLNGACGSLVGGDCNDLFPSIGPNAVEIADGIDNDCDTFVDEGSASFDDDGDCYCETAPCTGSFNLTCTLPAPGDCNDVDGAIYPGAIEVDDGVDNDCDGAVDEGSPSFDDDADCFCEVGPCTGSNDPSCVVPIDGDCDDNDSGANPAEVEIRDGVDNDCDGQIDNGTTAFDDDGDCFCEVGPCVDSVDVTCGLVDPGDCDDADIDISPGAVELRDGIDNDCDVIVDEDTTAYDDDGDCSCEIAPCLGSVGSCGSVVGGDCNDAVASIGPSASELRDGVDNDCDGVIDDGTTAYDDDGDCACELAPCVGSTDGGCGAVAGGDCNDADSAVSPTGTEILDGIDNNCDSVIDEGTAVYDDDGDCYCEAATCIGSSDAGCASPQTGDCNDGDGAISPDATEAPDGVDNDCDGSVDEGSSGFDDDGDCYCESDPCSGSSDVGCSNPVTGDCNDSDANISPAEAEVRDGIDNNCNSVVDEGTTAYDDDGDCYCETAPCVGSTDGGCGSPQGGDCLDSDAIFYPGAPEVLDGGDNDCDADIDEGTVAFDDDGDCYCEQGPCMGSIDGACLSPADLDCDDTQPLAYPSASEVQDGFDNDCDGDIDEGTPAFDDDGDCYCETAPCLGSSNGSCGTILGGDCNDAVQGTYPGGTEVQDLADNDCDGFVDEGSDAFDDDGDCYCETAPCQGTVEGTCGPLAGGDCDDAAPGVSPDAPDDPDTLYVDSNCDGIDGDVDNAIFLDPIGGSNGNTGLFETEALRSLDIAYTAAQNQGRDWILISSGPVGLAGNLEEGIHLVGGYRESSGWDRSAGVRPSLTFSASGRILNGWTIPTEFHQMSFRSNPTSVAGDSSFVLRIHNSDNLYFESCEFMARDAGNGVAGSAGAGGADGSDGDPGDAANVWGSGFCGGGPNFPGFGGASDPDCVDVWGGYGGGSGNGPSGSGSAGIVGISAFEGSAQAGAGGSGAGARLSGQTGDDGDPGDPGIHGVGGSSYGIWTTSGYVPANGGTATDATSGAGGGGGGGGGGGENDTFGCDCNGGAGGGGGGAGCGGAAGNRGTGGGSSVALLLINSDVVLSECDITTGDGGNGGNGGSGGQGGQGGRGGAGGSVPSNMDAGRGGRGGDGGNGGDGGAGGGGGGGPSIGVVCSSGSTLTADVNTTYNLGSAGSGGASNGNAGAAGKRATTHLCP